jgi:hypothetical protein
VVANASDVFCDESRDHGRIEHSRLAHARRRKDVLENIGERPP